jgi:hypothetical protein
VPANEPEKPRGFFVLVHRPSDLTTPHVQANGVVWDDNAIVFFPSQDEEIAQGAYAIVGAPGRNRALR